MTSGVCRACFSLSGDVSGFQEYFLNFRLLVGGSELSGLKGLHAILVSTRQWLVWNSFLGCTLKLKNIGK